MSDPSEEAVEQKNCLRSAQAASVLHSTTFSIERYGPRLPGSFALRRQILYSLAAYGRVTHPSRQARSPIFSTFAIAVSVRLGVKS